MQAVEKYRDLLQLESSLEELHELMVDFSNMVFMQGALVDKISTNIQKADNYVAKGTQELYEARRYQKKTRKLVSRASRDSLLRNTVYQLTLLISADVLWLLCDVKGAKSGRSEWTMFASLYSKAYV